MNERRLAKQPKLASQQEEMLARLSSVMDMHLDDRLQLAESLSAEKKDRSSVRRSLELFSREVYPAIRGLGEVAQPMGSLRPAQVL